MGDYVFGFKQTGQLLYVDGKEDGLLADILNGQGNLTAQQEEQLYRRYWGKLMGVAKRYVVDRETAREVVNDSFVKAFDGLSGFRGDGLEESHPAVEMDDRLQLDDIMRLLEGLPVMHRIVFNLYELEGYKHDEIAELLQIPVSSSRVYLTKAKQELRALYNRYFGGRYDG